MRLETALWRDKSGNRLVPDGDLDAETLAYPAGSEIPDELADRLGLLPPAVDVDQVLLDDGDPAQPAGDDPAQPVADDPGKTVVDDPGKTVVGADGKPVDDQADRAKAAERPADKAAGKPANKSL